MKLYTLKVNVKGSKPPKWRRIQIPSNLTFAQLAVVLETALECLNEDKVYQFEIYKKIRIFELDYVHEIETEDKCGYTYMDSPDVYINDFIETENKLTFRIFENPREYEEYKAEVEDIAEIRSGQKNKEERYTPVIIKESSAKCESWSDLSKVNEKMKRELKTTIGKKENLSFFELSENLRNSKGLTVTKRPVSRYDRTFNIKFSKRIEEIINDPAILFDAYKIVEWTIVCIETANMLYVVTPLEILYRLFCRNSEICIDFSQFKVYLSDCLKNTEFNRIRKDFLVPRQVSDDGMIERVLKMQRDIEYYIPEYQEIMDLGSSGYPVNDDAYIEFKDFLKNEMDLSDDIIDTICRETQAVFAAESFGAQQFIDMLEENGIAFDSEKQTEKFTRIMMRLISRTCKMEFRGHRPADMDKFSDDSKTRVIALKNLSIPVKYKPDNNFQEKSFLNPEAIKSGMFTALKVGPNEPCPCGSGKKYKKCCALTRG